MRWLIYTHVWLAVVASALTASVFYALDLTMEWPYLWVVFSGVMAVYNTHTLLSYSKGTTNPQLKIFIKYRKYNIVLLTMLSTLIGVMFLYHYLHVVILWYILLPAIGVLLYEWFTIQSVYSKVWQWVKPFLLSVSWLYYTVVMPQVITQSYHRGFTIMSLVFIFSIVMLFEHRDSNALDSNKEKSWMDYIGRRAWVNIYYLTLFVMILLAVLNAQNMYQYIWVMLVSAFLYLILRTRHVFTYNQTMLNWDGSLLLLAAYFILHHA